MTLYSIGVFLHVVAMLGLFIALSLEWLILFNLARSTNTAEVQAWLRSSSFLRALALSSMTLILLTGIYLSVTVRGWTSGWIRVSLGALFLIGFLGAVAGTRMRAVQRVAVSEASASLDTYHSWAAGAVLQTSIRSRLTIAITVVLLMITRPGLGTSLAIIGAALAAGLIWSASTWSRRTVQRSAAALI
jgi:uncharacterized membrane protein